MKTFVDSPDIKNLALGRAVEVTSLPSHLPDKETEASTGTGALQSHFHTWQPTYPGPDLSSATTLTVSIWK